MPSVWGYARFRRDGERESDWFRSPSALPGSARAYVGEMTEGEERRFFSAASPATRGPREAQTTGAQARIRNRIAMRHLDDFADVPHLDPVP